MSGREYESKENNLNRNEENQSSRNFLLGALLGGMAGAAAALLLAPKSGKELRNQVYNLLDQTGEVFDKSNELASITKDKTASLSKAVVQQSKVLVNRAKNFALQSDDNQERNDTTYISIKESINNKNDKSNFVELPVNKETDIMMKLKETQEAFDEQEKKNK